MRLRHKALNGQTYRLEACRLCLPVNVDTRIFLLSPEQDCLMPFEKKDQQRNVGKGDGVADKRNVPADIDRCIAINCLLRKEDVEMHPRDPEC